MTVMQGVRVTVAAVGRGYPKTAVTTVTAVTPKDGHPPKERRNPPMPYAILRFQKRKAGGVAACERHNERKKEAYKSNPDIDMERSKNNYHLIAPPKYTYKSNISGYVTAIADSARILCEQSGKTLSIQNNISDIPIGIDYTFVSQVNNNLISNAIRYATSKVNITYTSNNDGFYLSVSDNGCGFSKNILSKATNPYFTEEENHSEHFGLGLYICKILCEHHGGYLKIENCSIGAKVTAFFKSLD